MDLLYNHINQLIFHNTETHVTVELRGRQIFQTLSIAQSRRLFQVVQCLAQHVPSGRLTWNFFVMFMRACFINECVRRWLWGIHLLQRLRVPPGFLRFPRMPVVMLLQLSAPTLCLRKRTPQSHLLFVGNSVCLIASYGVAPRNPNLETICLIRVVYSMKCGMWNEKS